jgi:hypothetical protein
MWSLYPQLAHPKTKMRPIQRLRSIRLADYTLSRQRKDLNIVKRERWTEAELVIDVGDSAAAPHQSKYEKIYYRREGGRSERAPHFYLELLRQRLTNPNLEFTLKKIDPADVYEHDDGLFLRVELKFEIQNVGRVAVYDWQLSVRQISRENQEISQARLEADYRFANFPEKKGQGLSLISRPLTDVSCGQKQTLMMPCARRLKQCSRQPSSIISLLLKPLLAN